MSEKIYKWKRFWCPRTGRINLLDGGYPYNPDTKFGKSFNPDLVALEEMVNVPCLALLGEPGMGKSQEMKNLLKYTSATLNDGYPLLECNLRSVNNFKNDLIHEQEFIDWFKGEHRLYLFLDSLDEGLLAIRNLATQLVDEFSKSKYEDKINRLYLRIACRTAVWPAILEDGLKDIWEKNSIGVYELVPLRRVDVAEAASTEGFCPDSFLSEVDKKNLVPLAIKPVSLGFLFNIYRKYHGQFPSNLKLYELYLEGCKCLCEEVNQSRQSSGRTGNHDNEQRLIVAARIAAITILSNRFAVWTGKEQDTIREDVFIENLYHGHETAKGIEFEILKKEKVIPEVLDTGLFSSRGSERMGWAHQTYAEFLAAWYLVQHEIPLTQIIELFFSPEDPNNKLIPQLHETAAWLASMREDILDKIIDTDPDVLLRSDIPNDNNLRSSIVASLLAQCEEEKISFRQLMDYYHSYEKLKYPQLANQLRPYICDTNKQIDARKLAIYIAEVCEVSELQEDLVKLALDPSESVHLRASAAHALGKIGNIETRKKLKPLAFKQLPEDENDQLKGYILEALWADILSAKELFTTLTPHKQRNFYGGYQNFSDIELIKQLKSDDLVLALDWLANQGVRYFGDSFERLGNNILLKAWKDFDLPGVPKGFAKCTLVQWKKDQPVITDSNYNNGQFASLLLADSKKRRKLIEKVVLIISESEEEQFNRLPFYERDYYPIPEDTFWFFKKLENSDCGKTQKIWSLLLKQSFNRKDRQQIDIICTAYQTNTILQDIFSSYFEAIELDSSQAQFLKKIYLREKRREQDDTENYPLLKPSPKERVFQCLDNLEDGDLAAWLQLPIEMTLNSNSTNYTPGYARKLDLTQFPGWKEAEGATRRRIIEGAKKYIQNQTNIFDNSQGTNISHESDFAGCRALLLLLKEDPDFLNQLSSEVWQKWTPSLIISLDGSQNNNSYREIVWRAYQKAPEIAIKTLINIINQISQKENNFCYLPEIYLFDECWDNRFKLALMEKIKENELRVECIDQLLEKLLRNEYTEAKEWAKDIISAPLSSIDIEYKKQLIIASVLIKYSDSSSWSLIWEIIQQDSAWGHKVLELVFEHSSSHELHLNITEKQLADLYIWLVHQYPHDEDRDYSNEVMAHLRTPRDSIGNLRDSIPGQLAGYGTSQACIEIQRLIKELPELPWLRKTLIQAQDNMRRKMWQAPLPQDILNIVANIRQKKLMEERSPSVTNNFINSPVGANNCSFSGNSQAIGQQNQLPQNNNEDESLQAVQDNTNWIQRNTKWVIVSTVVTIVGLGWGLFSSFSSPPTPDPYPSVEPSSTPNQ